MSNPNDRERQIARAIVGDDPDEDDVREACASTLAAYRGELLNDPKVVLDAAQKVLDDLDPRECLWITRDRANGSIWTIEAYDHDHEETGACESSLAGVVARYRDEFRRGRSRWM